MTAVVGRRRAHVRHSHHHCCQLAEVGFSPLGDAVRTDCDGFVEIRGDGGRRGDRLRDGSAVKRALSQTAPSRDRGDTRLETS